jgi:hypothetical protein
VRSKNLELLIRIRPAIKLVPNSAFISRIIDVVYFLWVTKVVVVPVVVTEVVVVLVVVVVVVVVVAVVVVVVVVVVVRRRISKQVTNFYKI